MKPYHRRSPRDPTECCGLTFHPIKMADYDSFLFYKGILELRMSTLPIEFMVMDYASALFAMDLDSANKNGRAMGLLDSFLVLISLSLQTDYVRKDFFENNIELERQGDSVRLASITFRQGEREVKLTTSQLSGPVRELLAKQNGLTLPDESQNADILKSNEERISLKNSNSPHLNQNTDDLIASVAYLSNVSEEEILSWSVKEFESRRRAIDRERKYMLYGQAELSGMVKFKNGNPVPSLFFDVSDKSEGTMSVSDIDLPGLNKNKH